MQECQLYLNKAGEKKKARVNSLAFKEEPQELTEIL